MDAYKTHLIIIICVLLSVGAVLARPHLPRQFYSPVDEVDTSLNFYANDNGAVSSKVAMVHPPGSGFECAFNAEHHSNVCGMSIDLIDYRADHGIDFSAYDKLHVDLDTFPDTGGLRLALRTYFSQKESVRDTKSNMLSSYYLRAKDLGTPLVLSLDKFWPADWWVKAFNPSQEDIAADLSNLMAVFVELDGRTPLGSYTVEVHELRFSKERISEMALYRLLFFIWLLIFSILALFTYRQVQSKAQRLTQQVDELSREYEALEERTGQYHDDAITDSLTGLYNRAGFALKRDKYLAKNTNNRYSLCLIYIDGAAKKGVHTSSVEFELALKKLASLITHHIRSSDIAARWAGDEILVFCPDARLNDVYQIADAIRKEVIANQDDDFRVIADVTTGIAEFSSGIRFDDLVRQVDSAMFTRKKNGSYQIIAAESAEEASRD